MNEIEIYYSSWRKLLEDIDDEEVQCIFTDPPYNSMEKHRTIGTTTRLKESKSSSNKWFDTIPNKEFKDVFEEFYRVLETSCHLYVMADKDTAYTIKPIAEETGFTYWNSIVWNKEKVGMGYHYRRQHEFTLFFEKRVGRHNRQLNSKSISDVISYPSIPIKQRNHPAGKPPILAQICIANSTQVGDTVLDPFMGGGSTAIAAHTCDCDFIGCDIDRETVEEATKYIKNFQNTNTHSLNREVFNSKGKIEFIPRKK